MTKYQRRVVDSELDNLIGGGISAISLEGAKATGKSTTAAQRVTKTFLLEQPVTRQLLEADPDQIATGATVLVDEWQNVPATWGVVRAAVNAGAIPGQFFLTGSASAHHPSTHSGAGRIVSVRMRPMTLVERGVGNPTVSLSQLLTGKRPAITGSSAIRLSDYVEEIARSGFPAVRHLKDHARQAQLSGYIDRVIDHDFTDITGRRLRNPVALRRWMSAYAAATATVASYETIRDAATGSHTEKPNRTTTGPYRDAMEALFILDPVPAWSPTNNNISELASTPKHHLVDPALAVTLLGLEPAALLAGDEGGIEIIRDGTLLGNLFESLVTLDVRVFAQALGARIGHLRVHRGEHEIDLIVERRDRKVVALEVKLSGEVSTKDVRHLHWLKEKLGDNVLDVAVITTGPNAYRRSDGIAVIPAALLGP
ncbi:MAG TPA: DUF4143 domain-containing protein [Acidimicrobiales bacterium]|nr:DUF4143 domain-containing protein [Acidimicrobiales bacterium]